MSRKRMIDEGTIQKGKSIIVIGNSTEILLKTSKYKKT